MLTYNDARLVRSTSAGGELIYLRDTVAGAIMCSLRVDSYADKQAAEKAADCVAARWNALADIENLLNLGPHSEPGAESDLIEDIRLIVQQAKRGS